VVVCHCRAVSDCRVRQAIEAGAADIETIARQCGAGSQCGGCRPALAMLLSDLGLDAPGCLPASAATAPATV
jgi:bacterioferritin-associated ferredoxin